MFTPSLQVMEKERGSMEGGGEITLNKELREFEFGDRNNYLCRLALERREEDM